MAMAKPLTKFQRRFWNKPRLAMLRRRWRTYEDSVDITAKINAIEGGEPVTPNHCQQMAFALGVKRPMGFISVAHVRRMNGTDPISLKHIDNIIKGAKRVADRQKELARRRRQRLATEATQAAIRPPDATMIKPPPSPTSMGRRPLPFSMAAMRGADPLTEPRLRDIAHGRDGRLIVTRGDAKKPPEG